MNSNNQILLQKRSKEKVMFPLRWANSVCSHPLFNENERITNNFFGIRHAARRRLEYELNIIHSNLGIK